MVTYYDPSERKHMKEMTPIEFGEKEGYYYLFHENGALAVQGEYHWDQRVGDWTEFYPTGKRKKIVSFSKEAFDKDVRPYIKAEWNEKGKRYTGIIRWPHRKTARVRERGCVSVGYERVKRVYTLEVNGIFKVDDAGAEVMATTSKRTWPFQLVAKI